MAFLFDVNIVSKNEEYILLVFLEKKQKTATVSGLLLFYPTIPFTFFNDELITLTVFLWVLSNL